jgi:AbiV family abortive infection protein
MADSNDRFDYLARTGAPRRYGPVSRDQALSGIDRCIRNALRLTADAERLVAAAAPSSAGLAVVALEELSKVELLYMTATIISHNSPLWPQFWRAWVAHDYKAGGAALMLLNKFQAQQRRRIEPREISDTFTQLKECSWYVDFFDQGFLMPNETMTLEHATWIVREARRQVDDAAKGPEYDAWVYDTLHQHARDVTTQRELIEAQARVASTMGDAEEAARVRSKLEILSPEYLDGSVFDKKLPAKFFAEES